jgi:hypothetical protein
MFALAASLFVILTLVTATATAWIFTQSAYKDGVVHTCESTDDDDDDDDDEFFSDYPATLNKSAVPSVELLREHLGALKQQQRSGRRRRGCWYFEFPPWTTAAVLHARVDALERRLRARDESLVYWQQQQDRCFVYAPLYEYRRPHCRDVLSLPEYNVTVSIRVNP